MSLHQYADTFFSQATKHGVLGLMRSLRSFEPIASKIRINCVCPSMTLTGMVEGIKDAWIGAGLPTNTPEDIARMILHIAADSELAGGAVYVEGGNGWEIEQGLNKTQPLWLGERPSKELNQSVVTLGTVSFNPP